MLVVIVKVVVMVMGVGVIDHLVNVCGKVT